MHRSSRPFKPKPLLHRAWRMRQPRAAAVIAQRRGPARLWPPRTAFLAADNSPPSQPMKQEEWCAKATPPTPLASRGSPPPRLSTGAAMCRSQLTPPHNRTNRSVIPPVGGTQREVGRQRLPSVGQRDLPFPTAPLSPRARGWRPVPAAAPRFAPRQSDRVAEIPIETCVAPPTTTPRPPVHTAQL